MGSSFLLLRARLAFWASVRMGAALQGNGSLNAWSSFEYTAGRWGVAKAGVIILGFGDCQPDGVYAIQAVEKRRGVDAGGRKGWKKQGDFA